MIPLFIDAFIAAVNALLLAVGLVTVAPHIDRPASKPLTPPAPYQVEHTVCVPDAVDPAARHCSSVPGPAPTSAAR